GQETWGRARLPSNPGRTAPPMAQVAAVTLSTSSYAPAPIFRSRTTGPVIAGLFGDFLSIIRQGLYCTTHSADRMSKAAPGAGSGPCYSSDLTGTTIVDRER